MLEANRKFLAVIAQSDESIPTNIRQLLLDLSEGKALIFDNSHPAAGNEQLVDVREAARLLNISRSKLYLLRNHYDELTPIRWGGRVSYSRSLIWRLIERLETKALAGRTVELVEVRHVA